MTDASFVAYAERTTFGSSGFALTVPAAVQAGDIWVCVIGNDSSSGSATTPTGGSVLVSGYVATNSYWRITTGVHQAGQTTLQVPSLGSYETQAVVWFRNGVIGSVGTLWKRSSQIYTATCLALTRTARSTILCLAGDRSAAATTGEQGYTSVTNATFLAKTEGNMTLSAVQGICATWWATISPDTSPADVVWTLKDSSTNAFGVQIEILSIADPDPWPLLSVTNADLSTRKVQALQWWTGSVLKNDVVSVGLMPAGYPSVSAMLATSGFKIAHRGGSKNWPEMSLFAYTQSVAAGIPALEISLNKSSDGVWFGLHNQTLLATSGVDVDPSTLTWAQIQTYSISASQTDNPTQASRPYMRLEEILKIYGPTHVIFVDPKYRSSSAEEDALIALCLRYVPASRLVMKYFYTHMILANKATAAGIASWGYLYESDVPNLDTYQAPWTMLGMEYSASQSAWNSVLTKGKPVIGHICPNAAAVTTAISKGASGVMMSGFAASTL